MPFSTANSCAVIAHRRGARAVSSTRTSPILRPLCQGVHDHRPGHCCRWPCKRGVRLCSIHASTRLFGSSPRRSLKMLIAVPSPRLRTAPTIAHRDDCSRDLRPAKRGSGVSLHSSNPEPLMSALGHKRTLGRLYTMSALPPKGTSVQCSQMSALCHVWTAPSWQGLSSRLQLWSVQPCVRPLRAVHMTAGHNALRGSDPGQ